MTRFLPASLLAFALAVTTLGACDDSSSNVGYAYGAGGGSASTSTCGLYTTCGTCTPVAGCGWCFTAGGGSCATDPDSCGDASEFTWTWEPSGCPEADASVAPLDAGTTPSPEAATTD